MDTNPESVEKREKRLRSRRERERALHASEMIQCTILGDVFCSIYDVNVHVNNDVMVQAYCGVFISRMSFPPSRVVPPWPRWSRFLPSVVTASWKLNLGTSS